MWVEDNKPVDILSSCKIMQITEDNFLLWLMLINNNPKLDIKKYKVQIEEVIEEESSYRLFDVVPLNQFLKQSRTELYEKYKLLLE